MIHGNRASILMTILNMVYFKAKVAHVVYSLLYRHSSSNISSTAWRLLCMLYSKRIWIIKFKIAWLLQFLIYYTMQVMMAKQKHALWSHKGKYHLVKLQFNHINVPKFIYRRPMILHWYITWLNATWTYLIVPTRKGSSFWSIHVFSLAELQK